MCFEFAFIVGVIKYGSVVSYLKESLNKDLIEKDFINACVARLRSSYPLFSHIHHYLNSIIGKLSRINLASLPLQRPITRLILRGRNNLVSESQQLLHHFQFRTKV